MLSCEPQTPDVQIKDPVLETIITNRKKTHPSPSCREALRIIEQRDFVSWKGLPDCIVSDIFTSFDMSKTGLERLGSKKIRTKKRLVGPFGGYAYAVAFAREGRLILFQGLYLEMEETLVKTLVTALGEPESRERWWLGTAHMPNTEWIYPDRGITLFLNSAGNHLTYILLYAPTTLEYYMQYLRPKTRTRRHHKRKRKPRKKFKTLKRKDI